jgi:hypothetical protein
LLAAAPESIQTLYEVLSVEFDVTCCTTMGELQAELTTDLVVCGLHFDGCRMLELLRYCKAVPELRDIPCLCFRLLGGELDDTAYEGVEIACKALGAVAFIDLFRMRNKFGADQSHKKLRECVRLHAMKPPALYNRATSFAA